MFGRDRDNDKELDESIEEQILLQSYYAKQMAGMFSDFRARNYNVRTENTQTVKVSYGKGAPKRSSIADIENRAERSGHLTRVERAYKEFGNKAFGDSPVEFSLPKKPKSKTSKFSSTKTSDSQTAHVTLTPRLSTEALQKEYFLDAEVLGKLNVRQRILLSDTIFDQVSTFLISEGGDRIKEMYLNNEVQQTDHQEAVGTILSDCLRHSDLGMNKAGDFEPNNAFMLNLRNKHLCNNLLKELLDARNEAINRGDDPRPYNSVIKECYMINQDKQLAPHEKFEQIQRAIIRAVGNAIDGNIKNGPARSTSLPLTRQQRNDHSKITEKRKHSSPPAGSSSSLFVSRLQQILGLSVSRPAKKPQEPESKLPTYSARMFSVQEPQRRRKQAKNQSNKKSPKPTMKK